MSIGHVRPRGPSWEARVYLGTDPVTKKKRYKTKSAPTKDAAERLLKKLIRETPQSVSTEQTFGKLVERWLEMAEHSPSTRASYDTYLRAHILPAFGKTSLDKLSTQKIDKFYVNLRLKAGLAPASIHKAHVIIHRILQQGVRWRWLGENVSDLASPPSIPRHEITPPTPEEVMELLDRATRRQPDFGCFLRLAASTGARRGELCGLHWSDVDLKVGTVVISKSVVLGGKGAVPVERGTKTGNSRRVSLDTGTLVILRAHHDRALERATACQVALKPSGYVFSFEADGSKPWRPDGVTTRFMRLRNNLGLETRLHDLRHFVATQALAAGIPARNVAGRLGHARTSMTTDVYADWVRESDSVVADTMGGILKPTVQPETPQDRPSAP